MPPVKVCARCGGDVPIGQRCATCEPAQRRARRHPGYDDPVYRRYRARMKGRECENRGCHAPGAILHHVDGDPGHNDPSNYRWLCAPCATVADEQMRAERRRVRAGRGRSPWR